MLIEEGFKEGAHWAIEQFLKDLWHDAKEKPKCKDKGILIQHKVLDRIETGDCHIEYDSFILGEDFRNEEDWKEFKDTGYDCVDSWLCIDDLFPKQKGGDMDINNCNLSLGAKQYLVNRGIMTEEKLKEVWYSSGKILGSLPDFKSNKRMMRLISDYCIEHFN